MALEDKLLNNFHRLKPDQRQLIVEFSELLLKQAGGQISKPDLADELTEQERQRRLNLIDEISSLANPSAPATSNRDHDAYLYGQA